MEADRAAECLVKLLEQLRIPVARRSVYEELQKHPDHPSLLAFSDVLRSWGVPNGAYRVAADELRALPVPFLAHTATQGGEFRLIKRVDDGRITSEAQLHRPTEFTPDEFKQIFTGHVLVAGFKPEAGELNFRLNRRQERAQALRWPVAGAGALVVALLLIAQSAGLRAGSWHIALLAAAKSTGLLVAIALLAQSLGSHNPLLERLCTGGKNRSCTSILASPAAKLTEEISWAEVGLLYFASSWLALIALGSSASILSFLALLTLLSMPFTGYSLYYQARVARQWCVLCCAVQAVLWVEFLAVYPYLAQPFRLPTPAEGSALMGCLLAPLVGWVFVKPYIVRAQQVEPLRQQLSAFKRNQRLFQTALAGQPRYELLPEAEAIRLGNREARNVITVVSNPSCPPCARTHRVLDQWLTQLPDLQVQVLFTVPGAEPDVRTQVASHLLSLSRHRPRVVREALHGWYAEKAPAYDDWANQFPAEPEPRASEWLQKQREWCQKAAVVATPTILLNGRVLPKPYQLEDIRYSTLLKFGA